VVKASAAGSNRANRSGQGADDPIDDDRGIIESAGGGGIAYTRTTERVGLLMKEKERPPAGEKSACCQSKHHNHLDHPSSRDHTHARKRSGGEIEGPRKKKKGLYAGAPENHRSLCRPRKEREAETYLDTRDRKYSVPPDLHLDGWRASGSDLA